MMADKLDSINQQIQTAQKQGLDTGQISDGYHTFNELYEHRSRLWVSLCLLATDWAVCDVWAAKKHSDGTALPGYFVLGITNASDGKQISYHVPESYWNEVKRSVINIKRRVPNYDGHTSADVLDRLGELTEFMLF